jgi:hypothetical protein
MVLFRRVARAYNQNGLLDVGEGIRLHGREEVSRGDEAMKPSVIGLFALVMSVALWLPAHALADPGHGEGNDWEAPEMGAHDHGGPRPKDGDYHGKGHDHEGYGVSGVESPDHGKHHGKQSKEWKEREAAEKHGNFRGRFFRKHYVPYFQSCYGPNAGNLPPGLQKHTARTGHLPPGLEMQLERNGHLPPGLEKRLSPVSPCVTRQIGRLPAGTRLYLLGQDAVLLNEHTRQIVDILRSAY